ncbi:DUF3108 domain-containing protein [Corallococcus sp. H22C18031201]|nr:DUF3108 domain-containing protein [Corallococcus sp. H22C18031201]
MRRQSKWGLGAALTGLLWAGVCLAEGTAPSAFGPGEQAQYRVRYLGITAGTAQVTVGAPMTQWEQNVWPIVSVAKSDDVIGVWPIKSRFVSYWDAAGQRVAGSDLHSDENGKRRRQRIKMTADGASALVIKQKDSEAPRESTHELPPNTLDMTGATFALRNQALTVGREYVYSVFTGSRQFSMHAVVEAREVVSTGMGPREAFRVRVHTEFGGKLDTKRDLVAYLASDASHVPVRIEAEFSLGTVVAELTDYKPGRVVTVARAESPGG